jgi:hypothetical protein
MFAILQLAVLLGFEKSGRDSADKLATTDEECEAEYMRTVARRSSHIHDLGDMKAHCADGNQPGRWDRPTFTVTKTSEESSGKNFV